MEKYWNTRSNDSNPTAPTNPADNLNITQPDGDNSVLSEFDHHRLTLLANQTEDEGWQMEKCRYLKDLPPNVTKDTDIVEWWQVCAMILINYADYKTSMLQNNGGLYPTLRRITLDYLPCQASSVPCKWLFSSGGEVATKRQAQLGAARFEELVMMKSSWRKNIENLAARNLGKLEEVDEGVGNGMTEYKDMLAANRDCEEWDKSADEFSME